MMNLDPAFIADQNIFTRNAWAIEKRISEEEATQKKKQAKKMSLSQSQSEQID
jgi:hypothetical protein